MAVSANTPAQTVKPADFTFAQLEALWIQAGGSKALAPTMAAVSLAESGGNPSELNNNPHTGDYSVGLWQINYYGSLMNPRTKEFGSPAQLQADPLSQAKAAVTLADNGKGLANWTTYTHGAYLQFLQNSAPDTTATPAVLASWQSWLGQAGGLGLGGPAGAAVGGAVGSAVSGAASAATGSGLGVLGDLTSGAWWESAGLFVGGILIFGLGAAVFFSSTRGGRTVERTAAVAAVG